MYTQPQATRTIQLLLSYANTLTVGATLANMPVLPIFCARRKSALALWVAGDRMCTSTELAVYAALVQIKAPGTLYMFGSQTTSIQTVNATPDRYESKGSEGTSTLTHWARFNTEIYTQMDGDGAR